MTPRPWTSPARRLLVACTALALTAGLGCATHTPPRGFASPEAAAGGLVDALRQHDRAALEQVFGSDADKLLSSGDAVSDRAEADAFVRAYEEKNALTPSGDAKYTLRVGSNDWPLPIPIVKDPSDGEWYFDTVAGLDEVLNRRIGRNELDVIQVCQAIGDAQREYARRDPNRDGVPEYARRIVSEPGTRNGLYWDVAAGEPLSPLGMLAAEAGEEGYTFVASEPRPYHGYYYRLVTAQGPAAPGGAMDYVIGGRLLGGFAVIAHPADYGNSGIMTFMTSHAGVVYQKDLGPDSTRIARAMKGFDPGDGWTVVPDADATPPAE